MPELPPRVESLIDALSASGIRLAVVGDELRYQLADGAAIGDSLVAALRARKAELISHLRRRDSAQSSDGQLRARAWTGELELTLKDHWFVSYYANLKHHGICHVCAVRELVGELHFEALTHAFHALLARHKVLGTRYWRRADGSWFAREDQPCASQLYIDDLTGGPFADHPERISERIEALRLAPFSLASGDSLMRRRLIRLSGTRHILVLVMYHSICDAVSAEIVVRDLIHLYEAYRIGIAPTLPRLEVGFRDYSVWLAEWVQTPAGSLHLDYWRDHLRGVTLPFDLRRGASSTAHSEDVPQPQTFKLVGAPVERLRSLARREKTTPAVLALAAVALAVREFSCQKDITIAVFHAGRFRRQLTNVVGCLSGAWVLRVQIPDLCDLVEAVGRVREVYRGALPHVEVPYTYVRQILAEESRQEHVSAITVNHVPLRPARTVPPASSNGSTLRCQPFEWTRGPKILDELTGQKLFISLAESAEEVRGEILAAPPIGSNLAQGFCSRLVRTLCLD